MAIRFAKVNLSPDSHDYESVALRLGTPLLDRTSANNAIFQKVFGRLAAESEWHQEDVHFYVVDDNGGRLHDVACEPVTMRDVKNVKSLRADLASITKRLAESQAEFPDAATHQALTEYFQRSTDKSRNETIGNYFFRYRDESSVWRLVWCWGFQRRGNEPGDPRICTNSSCRELFVQRQKGSRDCPACNQKAEKKISKTAVVSLMLLLLLALGVAGFFAKDHLQNLVTETSLASREGGQKLKIEPATWSGPQGSQIEFRISNQVESDAQDITEQVVSLSEDPRVAKFERNSTRLLARSPGKTVVRFYHGEHTANATITIVPPTQPKSIVIEPKSVSLGVGSTQDLSVIASYADGSTSDLSECVSWEVNDDTFISCLGHRLEGLAPGAGKITARYRADENSQPLETTADVTVRQAEYKELSVDVIPSSFAQQTTAAIRLTAITADGDQHTFDESSSVDLSLHDTQTANLQGNHLIGLHAGDGKLNARLGELTATTGFKVTDDLSGRFVVSPKALEIYAGETTELSVMTGSVAPIQVESTDPSKISAELDVDSSTSIKVSGKSVGEASIRISQEAREQVVGVHVKPPKIRSIAFQPSEMSVAIDRSLPVNLVATTDGDESFVVSAESIQWVTIPLASIAELDTSKLTLTGRSVTDSTPQKIVARVGAMTAEGAISVTRSPLRLVLEPDGPIQLRNGESTQVFAYAQFGDGHRREIQGRRLSWNVRPSDAVGITFDTYTGAATATKANASITVSAEFQGFTSNDIVIRSTSDELTLALHVDRDVYFVGDTGTFRGTAVGTSANRQLDGVRFQSKDPSILSVDRYTGDFQALRAGTVLVGVQHPNASNAAVKSVTVKNRADAQLQIDPSEIVLMPGSRLPINAALVSGSLRQSISLSPPGRQTHLSISNPDAVQWNPPMLLGKLPGSTARFSISHEGRTAHATVNVLEQGGPLRMNPKQIRLSVGQAISPIVEQQVPGTEQWQEIDPSLIEWDIPKTLHWTAASGLFRPKATPVKGATGEVGLVAHFGKKSASMKILVVDDVPPKGNLDIVREPSGETLGVGMQQRYALVVRQGDKTVPASNPVWQKAFENDSVVWQPPVLTAKRPGYRQLLRVSTAGETLSFATETVDSPETPLDDAPVPDEQPTEVRLICEQNPPIRLAIGGQFQDFRVEADFPSSKRVDVTNDATLISSDSNVLSTLYQGVTGRSEGTASLAASYNGVRTDDSLKFEVAKSLPITQLQLASKNVTLQVGESVDLEINGLTSEGNKAPAAQVISMLPELEVSTAQNQLLRVDGRTLTGLAAGEATVNIAYQDASASLSVTILEDGAAIEPLTTTPERLRINVGQTKWIGRDVKVHHGGVEATDHLTIESTRPDLLRYDSHTRLIEGIAPGRAALHFGGTGQSVTMPVIVENAKLPEGGIIEILAPTKSVRVGETIDLRVMLVDSEGRKTDRTASAVLQSSDANVLSVDATRIVGITKGDAKIRATLPGVVKSAIDDFVVRDGEVSEIRCVPSQLAVNVGQTKPFEIQAIGPKGTHILGDHPDLIIKVEGQNPNSVAVDGSSRIRGVTPGNAKLNIQWGGNLRGSASVVVTQSPVSSIRIVPPTANLEIGTSRGVEVYANRGGAETLVNSDDGLRLSIANPSVAALDSDAAETSRSVEGMNEGTTALTARLGQHQAQSRIVVAGNHRPPSTPRLPVGLRFIPDVLRLQQGIPGGTVRLVQVAADGSVEDLDHRASFEVTPEQGKQVVNVKWTASGPVFVANKLGEADVHATHGGLKTRRPLKVMVVDPRKQNAKPPKPRLVVSPDPLDMQVGDVGAFGRVQLVTPGSRAVDVDYEIDSNNKSVVSPSGKQMRAVSTGQARMTIHAVGLEGANAKLSSDVTVNVQPKTAASTGQNRLVLSGPSRGKVGGPLRFRVELDDGTQTKDITNQGATLVLQADQASAAKTQAGCTLIPSSAGTFQLKARYKDLISNQLDVWVDELAKEFVQLKIEMDESPLVVGESRPYRVLGRPAGGRPQDLTHWINRETQPSIIVKAAGKQVETSKLLSHQPAHLVAKSVGRFVLGAALGSLKSKTIELEIVSENQAPTMLVADPSRVTIAIGESTPPITVSAQSAGSTSHPVAVSWKAEDESIAVPDASSSGRFIGKSIGTTQLIATKGTKKTMVELEVTENPFQNVSLAEKPNFQAGNRFSVEVLIVPATLKESAWEYRVALSGDEASGDWVSLQRDAGKSMRITSPPLKRGPDDTVYHLTVDARKNSSDLVTKYPLSFSLNPTIHSQSTVEIKP